MPNLHTLRILSYLIGFGLFLFASISTHALTQISDDQFSVLPQAMEMWIGDSLVAENLDLPSSVQEASWKPYQNIDGRGFAIGGVIWLKFQVQAKEQLKEPWLLILRLAIINHARIFTENVKTGEQWSSRPIGLSYPFKQRYEQSRHVAFPIDLKAGETYNLYFEMSMSNNVVAPLVFIKEKDFRAGSTLDLVAMGLVIGALLVMLLYNLGVSFVLREKTYFSYCAYVLSALIYILFLTGIAQIYIWPNEKYFHNNGVYIFSAIAFLSAIIFFRFFLNLKYYGGWLIRSNNLVMISWIILIALFILFPNNHMGWFINLAGMITVLFGVYVSVYLALKRNRLAIIFLAAWSFLLLGTIVFIMMVRGVLEFNIFTAYSQMVGMVIELVLLSYALAYRINLDREQAAVAQKESLVLAKRVSSERSKRLVAQEETLSLQRNINEKLEHQVEIRTHQYEDAMDKLERANVDLKKVSLTDQLSQVYNRRAFDDAVVVECKRARREKQNLSVILVDIDHFKNVNDTLGHTFGDVCIKEVAATLKSAVNRSSDLLARYGGEEFIFLLPSTSEQDAQSLAEKARKSIEELVIKAEKNTKKLTASFGVASWVPTDNEDDANLVKAADKALYVAKEEGRNCVRVINSRDELYA